MTTKTNSPKRKIEFPNVFVILTGFLLIASIATYFIPAGEYERVLNEEGRSVVVDGTYSPIESDPIGVMDIFKAIHTGMVNSGNIIFFIFIVGGAFGIFRATNTIEAAFSSLSKRLAGKEILVIPVIMLFFAIMGGSYGFAEEGLPFIMILIPLTLMLGYDSLVGLAVVFIGSFAGFAAAFMNPFTIGVAQGIAGLPLFSGMEVRIAFWAIFVTVSIIYVMIYARRVKRNPKLSPVYEEDQKRNISIDSLMDHKLNFSKITILLVLVLTLVGLAIGVTTQGWYIGEIAALFFIMGIIVGLINRMSLNQMAEHFIKGCEEMVVGALVVGFGYAVLEVLQSTHTVDTILYYVSGLLSDLPTSIAVVAMLFVQIILNFVIPSGSGQAALSMPIMVPLGDLIGISRQTIVTAFQFGDGISNIFAPTGPILLAGLAIARISLIKWFKWVWPLLIIQFIVASIFLIVANAFIWQ